MSSPAGDLPTFDALPLSAEVRKAVDDLGYVHPTPVQLAVFEHALRGKDLVVQARTGTGKTAAFGLPLVDGLVKKGVASVQALVLCPTRELALQVTREVDALAKHRGLRCAAVYGGAPMARQVADIRGGAQIVVGTPGRVLDHLHRGTLDPASIKTFVLDESDEMLSMGFLPQISEILGFLPPTRQTLLFSATLPPDIRRVAETRLKSPEFLTLSGDHIGALEINHYVYIIPSDKLGALIQVIEVENPESAIIFCNTKDETKRVAGALEQQGYSADWLNADLPQSDREKVMAATRSGNLRFLVATDVASRGIDISQLTHVINYDFPESAEAYVHRTGRTGRAGRTGTAIALVGPRDVGNLYILRLTYKLRPIERQLPSNRDKKTREETDLLRMFADAFSARRPHPDDLALARRLLSHDEAEAIIAGLLRDHLGARPDAVDEATAARRTRGPTPQPEAVPPAAAPAPTPVRKPEAPTPARSEAQAPERTPEAPRLPRTEDRRPARNEERRPERGRGRERRPERGPNAAPRARFEDDDGLPKFEVSDAPDLPRFVVTDSPPPLTIEANPSPVAAREGAPARAEEHDRTERSNRLERADGSDAASGAGDRDEDANGERSESEIYVSVGRRDGAKPSDFETVLAGAGVGPESTEYIRVRHRHAFVSVEPTQLERALAALNGATIAGRRANAERARRD